MELKDTSPQIKMNDKITKFQKSKDKEKVLGKSRQRKKKVTYK